MNHPMNHPLFPYSHTRTSTGRTAQIGPATYTTLEAAICQRPIVFRGTIASYKRVETGPAREPRDVGGWSAGKAEYTLSVKVEEVWKGSPNRVVTLFRETTASDQRFEQWSERKTSFLWFIGRELQQERGGWALRASREAEEAGAMGTRYPSLPWWALRIGASVPAENGSLSGGLPIFSMDLRLLQKEREAIEAARAFAKRARQVWPLQRFNLPASLAQRCRPGGDGNYLVVPLTPETPRTAFALLQTPERFLERYGEIEHSSVESERDFEERKRAESEMLREMGAGMLMEFCTEEHIKHLQQLLKDATAYTAYTAYNRSTRVENARAPKRLYPVRRIAYELLTNWGVTVAKPVLEETL
jgi:hypothetical protein